MLSKRDFSDRGRTTNLVELFVSRAGTHDASAWHVMDFLVEELRRETKCASALCLDRYLEARRVTERRINPDLTYDGYIEPFGKSFADGFRVVTKESDLSYRARFTVAHEICHTFFYELIPEIKFANHPTDSLEEALCNHGAASLLIPFSDLKEQVKHKNVSIATLEHLSERYKVSLETVFLRLRSSKMWTCEMTIWHHMTSGAFNVDRIYGWLRADWKWADNSIPSRAWHQSSSKSITGHDFVYFDAPSGYSEFRPIFFEIKRRGERLVSLWSRNSLSKTSNPRTLFHPAFLIS